jgi:hypothetical protein
MMIKPNAMISIIIAKLRSGLILSSERLRTHSLILLNKKGEQE